MDASTTPDKPGSNASTEEWRTYVLDTRRATVEQLEGLGRNAIRDTYGDADPAPADPPADPEVTTTTTTTPTPVTTEPTSPATPDPTDPATTPTPDTTVDGDPVPVGSNTAVVAHGDHDRVGMLSVKADGTPDQVNPEFIGDPDATLAATEEQFTQQAVSAADVAYGVGGTVVEDAPQDPSIEAAQLAQLEAKGIAKDAARVAVDNLHRRRSV